MSAIKVAASKGANFFKKQGVVSTAMLGMNAAFAVSDYKDARSQGYTRLASAGKAATTYAVGEMLGGWMIPFSLAPALGGMAVNGVESIGKMQRSMNSQSRQVPFINSSFNDYNQAFTMRQAGMKLAQQSQYNLQQTLMGNEASYLR